MEIAPAGANVFAASVEWMGNLLLGSLSQAVAVIAVASVGLLLFSGRIDMRRGVQVILGCFVLFGASSIASGIMSVINGSGETPVSEAGQLPRPNYPAAAAQAPANPSPFDPYAGAAMPTRQ